MALWTDPGSYLAQPGRNGGIRIGHFIRHYGVKPEFPQLFFNRIYLGRGVPGKEREELGIPWVHPELKGGETFGPLSKFWEWGSPGEYWGLIPNIFRGAGLLLTGFLAAIWAGWAWVWVLGRKGLSKGTLLFPRCPRGVCGERGKGTFSLKGTRFQGPGPR